MTFPPFRPPPFQPTCHGSPRTGRPRPNRPSWAFADAIFGGEHSAHYYFRDFWGADTGMLAALHVLALLGHSAGTMSALVAGLLVRTARDAVLPLWCEQIGLDAAATSLIFALSSGIDMTLFYLGGSVIVVGERHDRVCRGGQPGSLSTTTNLERGMGLGQQGRDGLGQPRFGTQRADHHAHGRAVEDAADALEPNADGRLHVLALAGGWPRAVVDVRAGSAAEAATVVRRAVEADGVRAPSGFRAEPAGGTQVTQRIGVHSRFTDAIRPPPDGLLIPTDDWAGSM